LKEVLRNATGIDGIAQTQESRLLMKSLGNRQFNLFVAGAKQMQVHVYQTDGTLVLTHEGFGDEINIDLTPLTKGAYVVRVNGQYAQQIML
ncbi:MAG: peptidase, partial [Bacteroidales bacterium]|nr:peptidase [Bacteroidales bacterium]